MQSSLERCLQVSPPRHSQVPSNTRHFQTECRRNIVQMMFNLKGSCGMIYTTGALGMTQRTTSGHVRSEGGNNYSASTSHTSRGASMGNGSPASSGTSASSQGVASAAGSSGGGSSSASAGSGGAPASNEGSTGTNPGSGDSPTGPAGPAGPQGPAEGGKSHGGPQGNNGFGNGDQNAPGG